MVERKLGLATRDAYGKALVELGKENPNVVVLDADLSKSTRTDAFGKAFPGRFIDIGIQEANLVGIASGLASCGKIPFISSFACFLMCKGYEQLRMGVAFPRLNVKVVTSHGGISVGEDGASQQSVEDFALACTLAHFTVIVPSDEFSAKALIKQSAAHPGPVYVRTGRSKAPVIYNEKSVFQIGKGIRLREGRDVSLIASGLMVFEALEAAELLKEKGISASVLDLHTLKPLDTALLLEESKKTGAFVVAEEHLVFGGLGSAVAQFTAQNCPIPVEFVGLKD
ncbi:MAG: transketolase family protein, partial [Candidatus Omnitrophica bacterium]|nr:transketolase family protein [Candidatus Omnitrophota bacterium]